MRTWLPILSSLVAVNAAAETSNDTWQTFSMAPQSGTFEVGVDVTPNGVEVDGVVGLSAGPVSEYDDLAAIVRFNDSGTIDVRDGDSYRAESTVLYEADVTYHLRMEVDVTAHQYGVWVTPAGQPESSLATDYDFRTTQLGVTELSQWATLTAFGTMEVESFTAAATTPPDDFTGAIAAGCEPGEYYDFTKEACVQPEERGCAAAPGCSAALLMVLFWRRLRV